MSVATSRSRELSDTPPAAASPATGPPWRPAFGRRRSIAPTSTSSCSISGEVSGGPPDPDGTAIEAPDPG